MSQKFYSDIEVKAGLRDSSGSLGASGQILSSTSGNVSWVTPTVNTVARDVQNEVKAGVAITKGQAVYVTGADGTNIIVGLASNTSEATSSKTLGLLNATVAINGTADVVQIGRLAGLNTIGATAGDPVWLGTNGNLIYGLINKPYAPAHLVFIGIVTRVNANNGEIFVSVQNGFELNEIHDVDLKTNVPINGDVLGYDGTLWVNKTIAEWLGYTPANASGTTNYVSKFTGATSLGNSQIFDNGTNVYINASSGLYSAFGYAFGVKAASGNQTYLSIATPSQNLDSEGLVIGVNADDASIILRDNKPLNFWTNNTERMRITSGGNVGIGTTSPGAKLDVRGGNIHSYYTYFANGENYNIRLKNDLSDDNGYLSQLGGTTSLVSNAYYATGGQYKATSTASSSISLESGNIIFSAQSGLTSGSNFYLSERMRITSDGAIKFNSYGSGTFTGTATQRLAVDSSGNVIEIPIGGGAVDGSGTTNYVTKWTDADTIGNSVMYDNGTNIGIGTTSPAYLLDINKGSAGVLANFTDGINANFRISTTPYLTTIGAQASDTSLALQSNGSERMRITSSGNVGIGTSSPAQKLQVAGNISIDGANNGNVSQLSLTRTDTSWGINNETDLRFYSSNSNTTTPSIVRMVLSSVGNVGIGTTSPMVKLTVNNGVVRTDTTKTYSSYIHTNDTDDFRFGLATILKGGATGADRYVALESSAYQVSTAAYTGGLNLILNPSSGNVGIGTISPAASLDVQGATNAAIQAVFQSTSAGISGYIGGIQLGNAPSDQRSSITHNSSGDNTLTFTSHYSGGTGNKFVFAPGGTERVRFQQNGNVGIGTSSPGQKLDVFGNLRISNTTPTQEFYSTGNGDVWGSVYAQASGTGSGASLVFSTKRDGDSATEKMRITSSGNVGIGTTSPSQKLSVNGNVSANNFIGNLSGTADQTSVTFSNSGTTFESFFNSQPPLTDKNYLIYNTSDAPRGGLGLYTAAMNNWDVAFGSMFAIDCEPGQGIGYIKTKYGGSFGAWKMLIDNASTQTIGGDKNFTNNLGIGTTSPSKKLTVIDNSTYQLRLASTNSAYSDAGIFMGSDISDPYYYGTIKWDQGAQAVKISSNSASGIGGITFETSPNTSAPTERMRITSGGNVGIGTTSPSAKLQVNGDIASAMTGPAGNTGMYRFGDGSTFILGTTTSPFAGPFVSFELGYSEKMRITSNGNVGIGTDSPEECALLHVDTREKGFLPPRMDTGQRNNIPSPVEGLIIWNYDTKTIEVYDGSNWQRVAFI